MARLVGRQAGGRLSALDGPARLLAATTATLPADRRDWGAAMAAELAQVPVQERAVRWRFAAGCARAAAFPPGGTRVAVGAAGALMVSTTAAAAEAAGAALPAGRVFVGLLGDRHARRFGVGMAVALVAGFVLTSRQELHGLPGDAGMMLYSFNGLILWVAGAAAAAAVGRSVRSGLWASAWATVLGVPLLLAAWLAEALHWYQQGRGVLLDGEGGIGVGANLGDGIWWTLPFLLWWALPLGVLGAAVGSARARRRRAREHGDLASAT